jgi:integrase
MGMAKLYLRYRTAEGKQSPQRPALYDKKKRLRPGWCLANGKEEHHPEATYSERYKAENGKWQWRSHGNDDPHKADCKVFATTMREELIKPVPMETAPEPLAQVRPVRIDDAIAAYIEKISKPDKNGEFRPNKSINAKKSMLEKFHVWSKKSYVKEVDDVVMKAYRDKLLIEEYEPDTVYNKLMTVTTFIKHNPLCPMQAPLPATEFPDKRDTKPDPYTEQEYDAMSRIADYEAGLLIYTFASTGMRKQEVAHAEREDIDWELGELTIRKKKRYNWLGKNKSARRTVRLSPELLAEYELRPPGLLFPAPRGGAAEHYERIIEPIAKAAGVTPTTAKPHMNAVKDDWCHRFRDLNITNRLHFCKGNAADLIDLCTEIGHDGTETLKKYFGKLKKPYAPELRLQKAANVTRIKTGTDGD